MKCPKCGRETLEVLNEAEELLYLCEECEILINGDEDDYEITKLYNVEDIEATMLYHDDLEVKEINIGDPCMADFVHKCLRCNSYGFEVAPGEFECASCGFAWEVQSFE